ncbi:MAG: acetyl-CoA carboxylase biotin carboxyl carrier protein [Streptococcaceae bacterium]|jgi:acetyl-CoA carboxylase biotin carboxyl carrier protein|nr:acetyl-CoA carboxylase biotin carboxyl carrier protein [Streptococcaceae bacterium]
MNIKEVKELLHDFDKSSVREFSWKTASDELSFSKNKAVAPVLTNSTAPSNLTETSKAEKATETIPSNLTETVPVPETPIAEGEPVTSPLVGTVYLAPAADKPAFVTVGDTVKKGQTLLIVEAMKVMNEIPAPQDGVVTEILVTSEQLVEYGQTLVRIK